MSLVSALMLVSMFFFFTDTATTELYTLSLHDALPISQPDSPTIPSVSPDAISNEIPLTAWIVPRSVEKTTRSEEHTSELQSHSDLVCRLLLEKKKKKKKRRPTQSRSRQPWTGSRLIRS